MGLRRLILIRHGAAVSQAESGGDRERSLAREGRRALGALAPQLGAWGAPDEILCSPARRTRETLEVLVQALDWAAVPSLEEDLYPGDYLVLLHRLWTLDPVLKRIAIVGHNPGIGELAARLSENASSLREFRPGAVAVFEVDAPWSELGAHNAKLVATYAP